MQAVHGRSDRYLRRGQHQRRPPRAIVEASRRSAPKSTVLCVHRPPVAVSPSAKPPDGLFLFWLCRHQWWGHKQIRALWLVDGTPEPRTRVLPVPQQYVSSARSVSSTLRKRAFRTLFDYINMIYAGRNKLEVCCKGTGPRTRHHFLRLLCFYSRSMFDVNQLIV